MSISLDEILLAKKLWWKSGGGSDISVQPLSVTENGTYTAESGQAYSPVAVNVPQTEVEPLTVNANGTYTPESGTAYGPVTVNVPSGSGGDGSTNDDVIFYDYDGSVVASYTASEFATVNALPANPSHDGLTAQGWNWSLEDAKTYVGKYGKLNIGQTYITDDGKTRIYIHLEQGRLAPYLGIAINGTATVEWGDGNTDTVTGTSTLTIVNTQHVYAAPGDYIIKIAVDGEMAIVGTDGTIGTTLLWKNITSSNNYLNRVYQSAIKKIEIGSNTNFSNYSFIGCYNLISITIPDSVTIIGTSAFNGCYNLTSITIPDGVTEISTIAFGTCYSLISITIPDSVTIIGTSAFQACHSLTSITIPNTVSAIGSSAFSTCHSLTSVTIPDGVTIINNNTFYSCYSLTSITIPDSVTIIGTSAFDGCRSLTHITISDNVTEIGTYAFRVCSSLTSITIPNGVTAIGTTTFQTCQSLASITIPDGITTIGANALGGCLGLSEIRFLSTTPPTVSSRNAFSNIPTDCVIYVPTGSLAAYRSATNYPSSTTYQYKEE